MLALSTGWTPDVLADLPIGFRAGCHWALYVRAILGDEGIPSPDVGPGVAPAARLAAQRVRVQVAKLREQLYPEDE